MRIVVEVLWQEWDAASVDEAVDCVQLRSWAAVRSVMTDATALKPTSVVTRSALADVTDLQRTTAGSV